MSDRTCAFPGCANSLHAKGLCASHNQQLARGASLRPLDPRKRNLGKPLAERFFMKVEKTETCWLWTGSKNHLGYGQIWLSDEKRVAMAHRVSVRLHGREIPPGYEVDHLCRNPSCVNPEHLEPVTHEVNMDRAPASAIQFQAAKTHCPQGHEYIPENTYLKRNASGTLSRECRTCKRARSNASRNRRASRPD